MSSKCGRFIRLLLTYINLCNCSTSVVKSRREIYNCKSIYFSFLLLQSAKSQTELACLCHFPLEKRKHFQEYANTRTDKNNLLCVIVAIWHLEFRASYILKLWRQLIMRSWAALYKTSKLSAETVNPWILVAALFQPGNVFDVSRLRRTRSVLEEVWRFGR